MKKIALFAVFFILAFSLYSQNYYESTPFGIPLREISSSQVEEFEYVLIYSELENRVVRQLLKETKEIKKWEREINWKNHYKETEYDHDRIVAITYVEGGLVVREDLYFDGEVSEIRYYTYENRELKGTKVEDSQGKLLYHNKYLTASNGRLARVVQSQPDKGDYIYSYQYSGNDLQRVIAQESDYTVNYLYRKGKLFSIERKKGEEVLFYKENPLEGVTKTVEKNNLADLYVQNFYNSNNQIVKSISWKEKEKTIVHYRYNSKALLIEKTIKSKGLNERYEYIYQKEDLSVRKYYKEEELLREAIYSAPNNYIEKVFHKGLPLFEVTYKDNVKTHIRFLSPFSSSPNKNPLVDEESDVKASDQDLKIKEDQPKLSEEVHS